MQSQKIKIIALVGPTGIGKTEIAIRLAKKLGTEIISCDSMQIYRYMDIGTAKPTEEEQSEIPHHMIDIVNPDESFDAAMYREKASQMIQQLHRKGKIPLIVGGTGFYLRSLIDGLFEHPKIPVTFRNELMDKYKSTSNSVLHQLLTQADPIAGTRIHANDRKRVLRALEIYEYTGIPISKLQKETPPSEYESILIALQIPMKELYEKINERVVKMMKSGWIEEVKYLRERGYSPQLLPMQSLGYKFINEYLNNQLPEKDLIPFTQRDTRYYAKRQMTWFRGDKRIQWVNRNELKVTDLDTIIKQSNG